MPSGDLTLEFKKNVQYLTLILPLFTPLQAELLQIYLGTGEITASSELECPHNSYKFQSNLIYTKNIHTYFKNASYQC